MLSRQRLNGFIGLIPFLLLLPFASDGHQGLYTIKLKAKNSDDRSLIANTGVAIETIDEDSVSAVGTQEELLILQKINKVLSFEPLSTDTKDFPIPDGAFHNEARLIQAMEDLVARYPQLVTMTSIGKSWEGRDIWALRITGRRAVAHELPGVIYMGGHHAREHLSVETPLRIWILLLERYAAGDERIKSLIDNRDIHVIPAVNPDGLEHDIASDRYLYWRKNRSTNEDSSRGVDLNRNYDYHWGTGGASPRPPSDTYRGPNPFSEPETRAIRDYLRANNNLSILLSFHTYSQLILYPWGHTNERISNEADLRVHEVMAQTMAQWNGYLPMQSSGLYVASGDATDWSYGELGIFSFTFELDPGRYGSGGFYPGAKAIPETVAKNIEPVLYLLEHSGNPYGVLKNKNLNPSF